MAIIKCPECGHQVSDHAKTCPSCGVDIAGNILRCPECGELVFAFHDVCPNCHHSLAQPIVVKPKSVRYDDEDTQRTPRVQTLKSSPTEAPIEQKRSRHPVAIAFVVFMVAAMAIVFLFIYMYNKMEQQNEVDAFERAISSAEPVILQDYLLRYPQAPKERRDSVQSVLNRLQQIENDWQNAYASKSRSIIKAFIDKYPQNIHVKEGRLTIDSLDWVQATDANTIESYEAYLKLYANQGEHSDEASMKIDEIRIRIEAEEKAKQDSIAQANAEPKPESKEEPRPVKK
ncbi:MAG: zinc ribbon domain-containing protein [Prevotella sp.]|nr:zinc ribbon domain-containing protein [Prevotella sp.]